MSTPSIQESSPSTNDVEIDTNITTTTTTTSHEVGSNMNQYNNNIVEELVKLISLSPSKDNIIRLGSTLSTTVRQIIISLSSQQQQQQNTTTTSTAATTTTTSQIAENDSHTIKIVYLRAIAQQFQYFKIHTSSNNTTSNTSTSSAVATRSTQNVQQYQQQQSSISNTIIDQRVAESIRMILSVINLCLLHNDNSNYTNLSDMSNTGIVQSLWYMIEYIGTNTISFVICEFLHICIVLKQYNFVYQQIIHTWPIPTTINTNNSIGTNLLLNNNNNNNQSYKLPTIDLILRYYYLRGIICMGCCQQQQQHNDHAIRCFWTCLSVPSIDDCNTISAITIAAWKKLILLQSLSPIGIIHTTINDINSLSTYTSSNNNNYNTDFHETSSVMMPSPRSSHPSSLLQSQSMNTIPSAIGGGGGPKSINPFATPIGMSFELVRFIKEAKLPSPHNTTTSDTSMQHDDSDMHIVPVESTTTNCMDNTTSLATSKQSMSTRYYPNLGVSIYKELINAFITIDRIKFDTIYNEYQDLFHKDGNYGYICRLYNALYYRQIYVISRIYATISLNDLSIEMNLSIVQLQSLLERMKSKLSWSIQLLSKENNIFVIFPSELPHPNLDSYYITPIQEQLMDVSNTVQQLNTMIESSKKYTDAIAFEKQNSSNQFTMI